MNILLNCFIEYLQRQLLTVNFLTYDIESAKKDVYWSCILKQSINCSITMYLILAKNDKAFWYKSVISCVEVYDKQIITRHFFISYPLSALVHISSLEPFGSLADIMT